MSLVREAKASRRLDGETHVIEPAWRPILFSGPMVKAILAGQKTQTRRLVKPAPPSLEAVHAKAGIDFSIFASKHSPDRFNVGGPVWAVGDLMGTEPGWRCPYGSAGDNLWVRETWSRMGLDVYPCPPCWFRSDFTEFEDPARGNLIHDRGCSGNDGNCWACEERRRGKFRWRPSIYMPRHLSRITLKVTSVRVERLNDISDDDARAEGCSGRDPEPVAEGGTIYAMQGRSSAPSPRAHFMCLWDSINWKRAPWHANPWVWVVSFRRVT